MIQVGTPPQDMIESQNSHPYIAAYGTSTKDVLSFYIEVERNLISVSLHLIFKSILNNVKFSIFCQLPTEYGFIQTFDVFFKLHHVLGLRFDKTLENMVTFLQRLVYGLNKGKTSTANMKQFFEKLSRFA